MKAIAEEREFLAELRGKVELTIMHSTALEELDWVITQRSSAGIS